MFFVNSQIFLLLFESHSYLTFEPIDMTTYLLFSLYFYCEKLKG